MWSPDGAVTTSISTITASAEDRGDDGLAPLVLPVDVLEVEDERELVEHERRTGAEGDRGDVDDSGIGVRREADQPADEDQDETRNHVVDVRVAQAPAPPAVPPREPRVEPRQGEREQERDQQQQERLLAGGIDLVLVAGDEAKQVHLPIDGSGRRAAQGRSTARRGPARKPASTSSGIASVSATGRPSNRSTASRFA